MGKFFMEPPNAAVSTTADSCGLSATSVPVGISAGDDDGSSSKPMPMSRAVHRAIKSLGHLTNFLPTGTALLFQFLLPIVSDGGECPATADKYMTGGLLVACALSCFVLAFTDTFTAPDGTRYYGFATMRGLWLPAGPSDVAAAAAVAGQYKLRPSDVLHAALSVAVFAASGLFAPDVKGCFYRSLPGHLQESLPVVTGFVASLILVIFPSKRRGFDEPPASPMLGSKSLATQAMNSISSRHLAPRSPLIPILH